MSLNREMGKENVVNIYTMEYYSAMKNEIMPFVATWMDLNITILSEIRKRKIRSSHRCSALMNPTSIYEDAGLIPGLAQWIKDPMLLGAVVQVVDAARIWALLWLWCRLIAIGPIGLLAWELPYVAGIDLKRKKREKDKYHMIFLICRI